MKRTLVVNFFGGPGCGKSVAAAYVFSRLKILGADAELVTEVAKDKVWEWNEIPDSCQMYIAGKQCFRVARCNGKVDILVVDSPIALAAVYNKSKNIKKALVEESERYWNYNVFINRRREPYQANGRIETYKQATEKDSEILEFLTKSGIIIDRFLRTDESGYNEIVSSVMRLSEGQQDSGSLCDEDTVKEASGLTGAAPDENGGNNV